MFTGIIEEVGSITEVRSMDQGRRLAVLAGSLTEGMAVGDSVCVNGACLTAVDLNGESFRADVSPETLTKTNLGEAKVGDRVNLERALRLSDRLNGHLISGHVDGLGVVAGMARKGNAILITVRVPEALSRYIVDKGSVAVDGVSLTVNRSYGNRFDVAIIPHTAENTTISRYRNGDHVNIETDMIGKYVERLVMARGTAEDRPGAKGPTLDMEFLKETGFL